MLTMQSGLAWRETGHACTAGSGNDVVAMTATPGWTQYVVDRPMAAAPGTTLAYDTGTAHLVSGVVSILTGAPADVLATSALLRPLGITAARRLRAPEGVSSGGFGLASRRAISPSWPSSTCTTAAGTGARSSRRSGSCARPPTTWRRRRRNTATPGGSTAPTATPTWPASTASSPWSTRPAHIPAAVDASTVTRWLVEEYVLPAAR